MRAIPLLFITGLLLQSGTRLLERASTVAHGGTAASASAWIATLRTGDAAPQSIFAVFPDTEHMAGRVRYARNARPGKTVAKQSRRIAVPIPPSPRPEVLLPVVDQPDIRPRHRQIADETLRALPAACRSQVGNFYVRYDGPEQRGLGGKTTIILSGTVPDDEFRALLIHEFGHITDLGCLTGSPSGGPSAFRDGTEVIWNDDPSVAFYRISWLTSSAKQKGVRPEDFVSGYASWDPFEDLAESYAYYVLHRSAFEERARENAALAEKLRWLQTYAFPEGIGIATGLDPWKGKVPWDVTKLAYEWHPPTLALVQK